MYVRNQAFYSVNTETRLMTIDNRTLLHYNTCQIRTGLAHSSLLYNFHMHTLVGYVFAVRSRTHAY